MKRKSNRSKDSVLPGSGRLHCHCGSPAVLRSSGGFMQGTPGGSDGLWSVPDIRIVIPL